MEDDCWCYRDRIQQALTDDEFHAWKFLFRPVQLSDEEERKLLRIVRNSARVCELQFARGKVKTTQDHCTVKDAGGLEEYIMGIADEECSESQQCIEKKEDSEQIKPMHDLIASSSSSSEDEVLVRMEQRLKKVVEFVPRSYQLEYLELVKKQNIIVYLDTGLGKTYIAMLAARYFLESEKSMEPVGRHVLILVPTLSLVGQHVYSFQTNKLTSEYTVKRINGDTDKVTCVSSSDIIISTCGVSWCSNMKRVS